jgi:hypothetical protein
MNVLTYLTTLGAVLVVIAPGLALLAMYLVERATARRTVPPPTDPFADAMVLARWCAARRRPVPGTTHVPPEQVEASWS